MQWKSKSEAVAFTDNPDSRVCVKWRRGTVIGIAVLIRGEDREWMVACPLDPDTQVVTPSLSVASDALRTSAMKSATANSIADDRTCQPSK